MITKQSFYECVKQFYWQKTLPVLPIGAHNIFCYPRIVPGSGQYEPRFAASVAYSVAFLDRIE